MTSNLRCMLPQSKWVKMVFDIISFSISSCCLYQSCKLGHNWDTKNWTKSTHFGSVYATQNIQKWVIVKAKSSYLCTGSGFIPAKSQNTLQLAIATRKRVKTALAAKARLWPKTNTEERKRMNRKSEVTSSMMREAKANGQ